MWARKRIDIGWRDLAAAFAYALRPGSREQAQRSAERTWPGGDDTIACLSVRSGLDLMLGQLGLPVGSEVLVSAVTITDMVTILRHHGLIAVPVDVNAADMSPRTEDMEKAITPRTKAMLIAHLFGTRLPLTPFAQLARERGLLLWEDCAQAFDGRYTGHPDADAVMFSFGPIKTVTALGGGLLRVRDRRLLARMRWTQDSWPLADRRLFVSRIARYATLKFLSGRLAFRIVMAVLNVSGRDPDQALNAIVRNFPGAELIAQLRHRAPVAMLRLLTRRLKTFRIARLDRQAKLGRRLADRLTPATECPGAAAADHAFWVFPICVRDVAPIVSALRAAGFDASASSQLRAVANASGSLQAAPNAVRLTTKTLYLPLYPELTDSAVDRLADVLTSAPAAAPVGSVQDNPH